MATVAVCVAIALAYPDRCLRAAVPFVSTGILWYWEIARYAIDLSDSLTFSGRFGGPDFAERAAFERDKRPQRRMELRHLVLPDVFSADEMLREPVVRAIRGFPDDLSSLTEAERASPAAVAAHRAHGEIRRLGRPRQLRCAAV